MTQKFYVAFEVKKLSIILWTLILLIGFIVVGQTVFPAHLLTLVKKHLLSHSCYYFFYCNILK